MLRKIIGTTFTKGVNAVLLLLIVLLSTNTFGAEGHGQVALFMIAITLNANLSGLIVYSIIYLTSRSQLYKLALLSYIFSIVSAFAGTGILSLFGVIPEGYFVHTVVVSVLCGCFQTNQQLLVGLGQIKWFNVVSIIQVSLQLGIFATLVYTKIETSIAAFMYGMGASQAIGFIPAFIILKSQKDEGGEGGFLFIIKEGFRYGSYSFMSNIAQFGVYRLPSYFVDYFLGHSAMGIYSAALQIAESIWLICRSIAMLVLSDIARNDINRSINLKITRLMRLAVYFTFLFTTVILLFSEDFFQMLLGRDFTGIKPIVWMLCTGIFSFAAYSILTAYFAGIGKPSVNTTGSFIGVFVVAISGVILIPYFGTTGAAITSSIGHVIILIYTVYRFVKQTGLQYKDLIAFQNDFRDFKLL